MALSPFHLAIPVHDVKLAREFYGGLMGLEEGRRDEDLWQDYNFYGHQLVCHFVSKDFKHQDYYNTVSKEDVPVPHFGIVLTVEQWHQLKDRIEGKVEFIVKPHLRFPGKPGEQWTMFFKDPSGNNL